MRGPAAVTGVWVEGAGACADRVGTALAANRASNRICMRREVMMHSALQVCRTVHGWPRKGSGAVQTTAPGVASQRRHPNRSPRGKRCAGPRSDSSCWVCCRSEEHTSELQSHSDLVCRLLLEKTKITGR